MGTMSRTDPCTGTTEPLLVVRGPVFAYTVVGTPLDDLSGPGMIGHETAVGDVVVRLRTPPGWEASYAGAVWMQSGENNRVRFVVHLAEDHETSLRTSWYQSDVNDPAASVSVISALDSGRRPLLYTYCRSDDGRCGVVYALLAESGRAASGIIVHGIWPAEYDRRLRPIVVAAANGVTLSDI